MKKGPTYSDHVILAIPQKVHEYQAGLAGEGMYSSDMVRRLLFRLGDQGEAQDSGRRIKKLAENVGVTPQISRKMKVAINFYDLTGIMKICRLAYEKGKIGSYDEAQIPEMLQSISQSR
jgi:hypothetical protein